jgi:DNA-binding HxlR family transcriptional regulator
MRTVRYAEESEADCAIAQALGVVGEWWTLLIVRDVAGGLHRFAELHSELG